ncbi:MAG: efflux RND transporter periplasmic adaptor subunit, partial [Candidatus Sericytochromatia bacterium]
MRHGLSRLLRASLLAGCRGEPARQPAEQPVAVTLARVETAQVAEPLVLTGTVEAEREVKVMPKISARVTSLAVEAGDSVRRGQVLVRLETEELAWQRQQQQQALATARVSAAASRARLERMRLLHAEGGVSDQQFEDFETQAALAEAQVRQLRA